MFAYYFKLALRSFRRNKVLTALMVLAIQTLGGAQNTQTQARHRHVLALLALHQAAGSLGDAELASVNALLGTR